MAHFEEADKCYERALQLEPGHAETHFNRALLWLQVGDWAKGWTEYEWRWRTKAFPRLSFHQPRWDGSPFSGRTLLVLAEQGIGDTLQFVRFCGPGQTTRGKVIFQCQPTLSRLLAKVEGIDQIVAQDDTRCRL